MARRIIIDNILRLIQNIGGNPKNFMGTRTNINFLGKDALLKMKDKKPNKRFVILILKNSKPGAPLLLHDEPYEWSK